MRHRFTSTIPVLLAFASALLPSAVFAQAFTGPGLYGGLSWAGLIAGPSPRNPVDLILTIINYILSFVSLAAVIVIIIAGIRLIISQGNDEEKDKAKKAILYAIIGLIIILISRIIVSVVWTIFFS